MRRIALRDILRGVDGTETQWLLDDIDMPGTTGLVRFEQLNQHSANYGQVVVKAAGLLHSYPTIEIAWQSPPGWSENSRMTPVGYYTVGNYSVSDTGENRKADVFMGA